MGREEGNDWMRVPCHHSVPCWRGLYSCDHTMMDGHVPFHFFIYCLSADWPKQEIVQWTNYVENFRRCSISFFVDMDCLLQKTNMERRLASQSEHVLKLIKFIWSIYKRVDLQNLPRKRKKTHSLLHPFLWHFLWLHYTAIFYYFSS